MIEEEIYCKCRYKRNNIIAIYKVPKHLVRVGGKKVSLTHRRKDSTTYGVC